MKCWYGHALKPRPRSEIEQDKLDPKGITFSKLLSKLFIFHTKLIFNCHNFTISTFLWEEPCLKLSNPGFGLKSCVHLFLMLPFKYETPIISIQANISSNHCLQLVVFFCFWVFEHVFFKQLVPLDPWWKHIERNVMTDIVGWWMINDLDFRVEISAIQPPYDLENKKIGGVPVFYHS